MYNNIGEDAGSTIRRSLALLAATSTLALSVPAYAQGNDEPPRATTGGGFGEIVVTARKRAENVQDVPLSIAAISPERLQEAGVRNVVDLTTLTPGLQVQQGQLTNPANSHVNIRGYSQRDDLIGFDQPTPVYIDSVFAEGLAGTLGTNFFDVDRVEVLKGPQGTLFGRNSVGGALLVYTNAPTDRFEGEVLAGVANRSGARLGGVINLPLSNNAAFRLTGEYEKVGGWAKNLNTGGHAGGMKTYNVRGQLKWNPTDNLQVLLRGTYGRINANGIPVHLIAIKPGSGAFIEGYLNNGGDFTFTDTDVIDKTNADFAKFIGAPKDVTYAGAGQNDGQVVNTYVASSEITYDFSDAISLKSITGYRKLDSKSISDVDGTPFTILTSPQERETKEFSQELQLNVSAFDERLDLVFGGYYYHFKGNELQQSRVFEDLLTIINFNGRTSTQRPFLKRHSEAFYAQGTFAVTDTVNLTLGGRHTWESTSRDATGMIFSDYELTNPTGCNVPFDTDFTDGCSFASQTKHTAFTWLGSVDWQPVPDVMFYGKVARGFRAGGPQARISTSPGSALEYDPEYVTEFEGGVKSMLFDRLLRFNAAFFYDKLTDAHFSVTTLTPTGFAVAIQNAGKKDIYGLEAELEVAPADGLRLGGTLGWTQVKFKEVLFFNTATDSIVNVAGGYRSDNVPEWTYSLYGAYTAPTDWGSVGVSLNWRWQNDTFVSSRQIKGLESFPPELLGIPGFTPNGLTDAEQTEPAYGLLGGQIKMHIDSADVDISFWGKNILNKKSFASRSDLIGPGLGIGAAQINQTRTFGVEVSKRF